MRVPDVARVRWTGSVRLVPASYPPVRLFEDAATPADLDTVLAVLRITDPQTAAAAGDLSLVAPEARVSGPGSSPIMAAFTHPSPDGSRFAAASSGAYCVAHDLDTAIREIRFHQTRRLMAASLGSTKVVLNVYLASIDVRLHDVRAARRRFPDAYVTDPVEYARSQAMARQLRAAGSSGIAYDSVRNTGGQCVALFDPRAVTLPVEQRGQVVYRWDAKQRCIAEVSTRS